ncbi:MAG: FtsQ-type POTRA domain-containing protein [bacterium]|nr:FtsQ-type POTRA domain-containing protein [bacterium]
MKIYKRQVKIIGSSNLYRPNYPKPQKRPFEFKHYFKLTLFILIAVFLIYIAFFSPFSQVGKITVVGKTTLPSDEITRQVNQAISASITGRSTIFLNTSQIEDQLINQNYQFSSVKIERVFPNGIKINVKEKQPSIIWRSGSSSYVLSEDGRTITDMTVNYSNLPTINDSANLPVKIGDKLVPASFVTFVLETIGGLNDRGIKIISMEVPDTTSELYIKTDKAYLIKFDTNKNATEQLVSLDSVLKTLSRQNKKPSEYIDLRVEGRIFYK